MLTPDANALVEHVAETQDAAKRGSSKAVSGESVARRGVGESTVQNVLPDQNRSATVIRRRSRSPTGLLSRYVLAGRLSRADTPGPQNEATPVSTYPAPGGDRT
jgi:hypothetical protein